MKKITLFINIFLLLFLFQSGMAVNKAKLRWLRDKPLIDSIVISGNHYMTKSEIKDRMYSRKQSSWRKLKKDRRIKVQRETLGRDTLEIKYLYLTKGFLNIQVGETFSPLDKYQKIKKERENDSIPMAMLWVNIDEGTQYFYGTQSLHGNFEEKFKWPLTKLMQKLKPGKPANPIEINKVTFDMKTELANHGYPYSTITFTIDTLKELNRADVSFYVDSDSLVYFGEVTLEGINHFPEYVGLRELKVKKGELYSRQAILDSQKRLFESGYFTFSQLTQSDSSTNRLQPDFTLKVRERKSEFFSLASGVSQSKVKDLQWDFNLGAGKRDVDFTHLKNPFKNGGHRFSVFADYSFSIGSNSRLITHRYRMRYTTPWTFGIRMPLTLTFEIEPRIKSQVGDFKIQQWAFSVKTSKWFGDEIRTTAGLEYNNVQLDTNIVVLQDLLDISIRRKIFTTFRLDSRDNIFLPTKGQLSELSVDYYGGFLGGDNNFYKLEAAWSTYQKVWPGWIYAVRLKGGVAKEFGISNEVPIDERLYLGGANTIRGFTENSLGPVQVEFDSTGVPIDSSAIGANYTLVINHEFRWRTVQFFNVLPIVGNLFKKFPQWQSLFFDAGNGFSNSRNIKFSQFAYSYGTGFQIVSPAGPIRIDYARRIKTDRYDVDSRWHFTILYAF